MQKETRRSSTISGDMGIELLPQHLIAHIITLTTPADACRSSVLSISLKSIADSDDVWRNFLPSECQDLRPDLTRKQLYIQMCDHPLLLGGNSTSLSLERHSGKKCWMLSARALSIAWVDDPRYWRWIPAQGFRFPEVACLLYVWWLDITGRIPTERLSPQTNYAAYLVFSFADRMNLDGFRRREVTLRVGGEEQMMYLVPPQGVQPPHRDRGDGWREIRLGNFYNNNGDDGDLVCNFREVDNFTIKNDLIVGGIELRPA